MVVADGGSGQVYRQSIDDYNEIQIDPNSSSKEIIEWLEENIGKRNDKWRYWDKNMVKFVNYDDAWDFMEWLEKYERE